MSLSGAENCKQRHKLSGIHPIYILLHRYTYRVREAQSIGQAPTRANRLVGYCDAIHTNIAIIDYLQACKAPSQPVPSPFRHVLRSIPPHAHQDQQTAVAVRAHYPNGSYCLAPLVTHDHVSWRMRSAACCFWPCFLPLTSVLIR